MRAVLWCINMYVYAYAYITYMYIYYITQGLMAPTGRDYATGPFLAYAQPLPVTSPAPAAPAGGGGKGDAGGGERQEEGMSVPVHRCIGGSSGRHFISGSADCMGRGKLEKTLGYAAVHKSSNTPVRRRTLA